MGASYRHRHQVVRALLVTQLSALASQRHHGGPLPLRGQGRRRLTDEITHALALV